MKRSENINELATALVACQSELKDVYKGTKGYGYQYATLDKVYDEVRPKSTAHGLSLTHQKSFNREMATIELTSLLIHTSGQWIEYNASLPFASMKQMNDYQAAGSGFTYLERYQTSAIFAITADEDQDAHGEQEQPKRPTASKANSEDKKAIWGEFIQACASQDVDPMEFLASQIDITDKNLVHNTVVKWLKSGDMLRDQLMVHKQSA